MLKQQEVSNPKSCLSRARDDEYVFVLLARDVAAADTIRYWIQRRIELGKNKADDPQILEAASAAGIIEDQHRQTLAEMRDKTYG